MITSAFSITATERILPKLAFDFTTATLDSRITFSRLLNTATRVNNFGYIETVTQNTPRFDYDPNSLSCKGLLIEESRQNLVVSSTDMTNTTYWTGGSNYGLVGNQPDLSNGTAAVNISDTAASSTHLFQGATFNCVTGNTYTVSAYFKKGTATVVQLFFSSIVAPTTTYANFDINNGIVGTVGSTATATIQTIGNGWYRCTMTGTANQTNPNRFFVALTNNNTTAGRVPSYAGSGQYFTMCNPQVELGAFATSYIPNVGNVQNTRNADDAIITGANFTSWWTAGGGAMSAIATPYVTTGIRTIVQFDNNSANNIIAIRGNAVDPEFYIVNGGIPQVQIDTGTITAATLYKVAAAWDTNNCAAAKDGANISTSTTAIIPSPNQARIGSDGTTYLNGWVQSILYWPQRITNAQVQAFSKQS